MVDKFTGDEVVGKDPKKKETSSDLAADYGWSVALLNSDPDLRKVFDQAVHEGWEPTRFVAELRDTKWFQTHAEAWRTNETLKVSFPADWKAKEKATSATIQDLSASMGGLVSGAQLKKLTDNSMMFGWNDAQIRNVIGGYVKVKQSGTLKGQYIGEAGKWNQQLVATAKANGYKIPKGKMNGWLKEIVSGNATAAEYEEMMRRQAAHSYPAYADELYAGSDLTQLVGNYRSKIANLLEIDEDRIGLDDKLLGKAMSYKDAKGKAVPMPIGDFEDKIRQDHRWQYTDNAHEQIMGQTLQLGRMFGKTG